jgi:putative lipoic acid-binding regulatory protein
MSDDKIWQFPCEFPLKVFGKIDSGFETFVLTTIRKHVAELPEDSIESRASKNGAYLALTIKITATSKEQLDAIYRELSANELVLMAL